MFRLSRTVASFVVTIALVAVVGLSACSDGTTKNDNDKNSDSAASPSTTEARTTTPVEDRSDAPMETVTVFRSGEDGYATYRIPAVVESADGTLVAFAEGRVNSVSDDGNVDLLAKRSTDGGKTWGDLQVLADMDKNFIGNPSPVLDTNSGRLILFATYKNAADKEIQILTGTGVDTSRQYLLTSEDNGVTWSKPTEITDSVKKPEWRWYSVGPGHAFQLRTGPHKGRLVAPANHSDAGLNYGAHLLLSDDGGRTWRIGAVDTPQGGPRHPNESTGAQLPDGTIVISARDQEGTDEWHRLRTTSTDGGESFVGPFEDITGLVTPVVQESMLWVDNKNRGDGLLLLSGPSTADERVDLHVRTSTDGGLNWAGGLLVRSGPAAYSDLIRLPGHSVGVLYETGDSSASERIDFTTFGVDQLAG